MCRPGDSAEGVSVQWTLFGGGYFTAAPGPPYSHLMKAV
jgi:hypothetical protein